MIPVRHAAVSFPSANEPSARPRSRANARIRTSASGGVSRLPKDTAPDLAETAALVDADRVRDDIDALVEGICEQGCKVVYQVIASLQAGEELARMVHLDRSATLAVLAELESIMAVYAENGSVCLTQQK